MEAYLMESSNIWIFNSYRYDVFIEKSSKQTFIAMASGIIFYCYLLMVLPKILLFLNEPFHFLSSVHVAFNFRAQILLLISICIIYIENTFI